jgi:hypothetical protein
MVSKYFATSLCYSTIRRMGSIHDHSKSSVATRLGKGSSQPQYERSVVMRDPGQTCSSSLHRNTGDVVDPGQWHAHTDTLPYSYCALHSRRVVGVSATKRFAWVPRAGRTCSGHPAFVESRHPQLFGPMKQRHGLESGSSSIDVGGLRLLVMCWRGRMMNESNAEDVEIVSEMSRSPQSRMLSGTFRSFGGYLVLRHATAESARCQLQHFAHPPRNKRAHETARSLRPLSPTLRSSHSISSYRSQRSSTQTLAREF